MSCPLKLTELLYAHVFISCTSFHLCTFIATTITFTSDSFSQSYFKLNSPSPIQVNILDIVGVTC